MKAAETLGGPVWVVKAQIHAGGRGKGGGVKVVKSVADVKAEATRMLGMTLVTHRLALEGKKVQRLYIEEGTAIARELYLSILVDARPRASPSSPPPKAAWTSRRWRMTRRRRSSRAGRSGRRLLGLRRPPHRRGAEARGRPGQAVREDDRPALQGLRREGYEPAGDQPARRYQGWRVGLPRRQDQFRLQRARPSPEIKELRDLTEEDPKEIEASKYDLSTWRSMARSAAW